MNMRSASTFICNRCILLSSGYPDCSSCAMRDSHFLLPLGAAVILQEREIEASTYVPETILVDFGRCAVDENTCLLCRANPAPSGAPYYSYSPDDCARCVFGGFASKAESAEVPRGSVIIYWENPVDCGGTLC